MNPYRVGDKVTYKDYDGEIYTVLDVLGDKVSLSLADYDDVEQDIYTDIGEIVKV